MATSYSDREGSRNQPSFATIWRMVGFSRRVPSEKTHTGVSFSCSIHSNGTSLRYKKSRIACACGDPARPYSLTGVTRGPSRLNKSRLAEYDGRKGRKKSKKKRETFSLWGLSGLCVLRLYCSVLK